MKIWQMATNIEINKRAPTVFLCLPEKAKEAHMEMDAELLNRDDGLDKMFEKLTHYTRKMKMKLHLSGMTILSNIRVRLR